MQDFEVVFYDRPDGSKPALEFVLGLDTKMRAKMFRTIEMLEKNGNELAKRYRTEYLSRKGAI